MLSEEKRKKPDAKRVRKKAWVCVVYGKILFFLERGQYKLDKMTPYVTVLNKVSHLKEWE